MKKRNVLLLTALPLIATKAIRSYNKSMDIEKVVTDVWNSVKDELVQKLDLKQEPTLDFNSTNEGTVMHTMVYTEKTMCGVFESIVTKTHSDYVIHVNKDTLIKAITEHRAITLSMNKVVYSLIKFLLAHECRHIWQAQSGFNIGKVVNALDFSSNQGYGESREETDANEFAIACASSDGEKALFSLQKSLQDSLGKVIRTTEEQQQIASFTKDTFLRWNPITRLFY